MSIYIAYLIIFLLGATPFFEVVGVIPIGVAAGLPAVPVAILAFAGNILTIWLLILMMDHVKKWMKNRKEKKGKDIPEKRQKRAANLWKKYGLPGLAILSPFLIGSHFGAILAMGFGGTRKRITFWMTISVTGWTIIMGIASYYGIDFLYQQTDRQGFLSEFIDLD
ncbi:putative membrane protein [Gracilibacillus halotolerans]|uniref:Putative membrane protein n=1 Tax=Gracilibacillus halotolerans TaxID=74386 RepID=A0A841RLT9_9BACI|nr:small multi-drug export protein [Gracilibacillus halotolerans]MBB6513459.1 putative membrane protein [Gracilibacillus halotolerans]